MHYQTWIICRLPRVRTADGKVRTILAPWADPNQRYTFWFEAVAIELAQLTKSPTKTAGFLDTSYDVICGIIDRAVRRGLARRTKQSPKIRRLALDEKAFQRGHQYITVLSCPDTGRVYEVALGRKQEDAEQALQQLDRQVGLHQVQAVSMDMWKTYMNSVSEQLPNARIVHGQVSYYGVVKQSRRPGTPQGSQTATGLKKDPVYMAQKPRQPHRQASHQV